MQSKAATIDAYLEALPDERREISAAIRTMVNRAAPRCHESMAYGMPGWDLGGHWIALAWQRHCLALFVSDPDLVRELASAAGSRDFGMSCMRWPSARHVKLEGLRVLIETAARRRESLMAANSKLASAKASAARRAAAKGARETAKQAAAAGVAARKKPATAGKAAARKRAPAKRAHPPRKAPRAPARAGGAGSRRAAASGRA